MSRGTTDQTVVHYYGEYDEKGRLDPPWGQIEFLRSQHILGEFLPPPPAVVLDVGGAAGRYACWLAQKAYAVHLVDPVPLHIEQAQAASDAQAKHALQSCRLGDARDLPFDANSADAVLLMGPLYHLQQVEDRVQALREAWRVLRKDGILVAAGISRFASMIDGLDSGYVLDPAFREIMLQDLKNGKHHNPTDNPAYFTDAYFHHPNMLRQEIAETGFKIKTLCAVEGLSYMMRDLKQHWANPKQRGILLDLVAQTAEEPTLIGASPHIICVGAKMI